jgi:hypothetical protein
MELSMKTRLACTLAAGLAMSAASAYAEPVQTSTQFRTAQPQAFTTQDLQRYGLDADAAELGVALQEQGYQIVALTPEEAKAYSAGAISQTEWILIGIGVLIILAVA